MLAFAHPVSVHGAMLRAIQHRAPLTLSRRTVIAALTRPPTFTTAAAAGAAATAAAAAAAATTASFCIASAPSTTATKNPLLADSYFPKYAEAKAEHVSPAIETRIAEATAALEALESRLTATLAAGRTPAYLDVADASERIGELVGDPWGTVMHLKGVKDSSELRAAVDEAQPKVTAFNTRISQSEALYKSWVAIREDKAAWSALDEAQQRVVTLEIRGAELQGIGLVGPDRARFNEIQQELAKLRNVFSNQVLDGTKAFSHRLTRKEQVAGLPKSALSMLAATARRKGDADATADEGPWVVTLDGPSLLAVLRHADDGALREKVYRAYVSRASEHGDGGDNAPTIERILALRAEQSKLLGFESYAAVSLAKKMATLEGARALLEDLRVRSFESAKREHAELEAYAGRDLAHWCRPPRDRSRAPATTLDGAPSMMRPGRAAWLRRLLTPLLWSCGRDVGYYAERLKKEKFSFGTGPSGGPAQPQPETAEHSPWRAAPFHPLMA